MNRLRTVLRRALNTVEWLWKYWRTAPADRFGLVPRQIVKAPLCWWRDHDFGPGGAAITSWRLQFCQCCGEEIAWRTGFHQIDYAPDDLDPCDEFARYDEDDDAAPADWDELHDHAVANGGPF